MKCTEESFLKDVANHQMTVLRDDGVHRHIRFKRPGTNCMYFDLVTWPGFLCYSGDMGCYVFQRLEDMFEFFRTDRWHQPDRGQKLFINLGYWAEKVQAEERNEGVKKYSADKFREKIEEWTVQACEEIDVSDAERLRQEIEERVLCNADEGEQTAMGSALGFEFEGNSVFQDFWDNDLKEYTYRFIWCCYALAWGIQKYDQARTN